MKKIQDRITLGIVSSLIGTILKTVMDEVFLRNKITERSLGKLHQVFGFLVGEKQKTLMDKS